MMEHTFHLHGMFMELENEYLPLKHRALIKPAERVSLPSPWICSRAAGRFTVTCSCTWKQACFGYKERGRRS